MPPLPALLTHNQLPHFLPADQAARFMHQGDGDPPLDTLRPPEASEKRAVVSTEPGQRGRSQAGCNRDSGREYLVEQEGAVARHASAVVHNGRDVAGREDGGGTRLCSCAQAHHASLSPRNCTQAAPFTQRGCRGTSRPQTLRTPPPGQLIPREKESSLLGGAPGELAHAGVTVPGAHRQDLLAVGLQLADLEEDHQVVLALAGSGTGTSHGAQFGGRHCSGWEGRLNVEAGKREAAAEVWSPAHSSKQGKAEQARELGSDRRSQQAGQQQGSVGGTLVQGDPAPSWGPRWPSCASSRSQSRAARVQDGASPGDTHPSPAAPAGAGTGPKPHSTTPAPGEQLVDSRRGAAGTYPSVLERDAGRHHSKPPHSAEPEQLGSQQPEAVETCLAPARAASGAPGTACPRGRLRQETRGAAGPATAPCGHEPGFCAFPTARSVAGRGGGQAGSSTPCRRREVAAVAAASTCPESVSRSEPARAAGTEHPVSRRGLVCSCGEGRREGDKQRGQHKAKRLHTDTQHEGGGPRGCREHRGKSACKGVCVSRTLSEWVLKGLRVLWCTTHFVTPPQALPCKPMARGRRERGAAGDLVCSLGTAGEGQDAVSYLAWRAASPAGSGAGMASVGCRENRLG